MSKQPVTDEELVAAAETLLRARIERGAANMFEAAKSDADRLLDRMGPPKDDAIADGPRTILLDADVRRVYDGLSIAAGDAAAQLRLVRRAFGFLGL